MKPLLVLPLLLASSASFLIANGGGYRQGVLSTGPFRPANVDSVEMVSEKLDIELKRDAALISIIYQLHNPDGAVKVSMGFPCSIAVRSGAWKSLDPNGQPQLEDFSLKADGQPVASQLVEDQEALPVGVKNPFLDYESRLLTGWQKVTIPFAKGQTRTLTVSYRNPYYREVSAISSNVSTGAPMMRYLFSAAALWKGTIKSGEVTVRATGVDPEVVSLSHPKRFKREGNQWSWNFTDFEPTMQDDLEIIAGEHEFSQPASAEAGETGRYVMRGKTGDRKDLQQSGKWFFIGRQYTATASSSLKSEPGYTYGPENLVDQDRQNVWVEGAKGDGLGESVTMTMKKPQKATRIFLANGYRRDPDVFTTNNRIKRLGVSVNGNTPFSVELPDGIDQECAVDLPKDAGPLKTLKLIIEEVYRGTQFRDTCLSGVDIEVQLSKAPPILPCR